jgi:flagellar motility protein MotE (MotC chaperone)
VKRTTKIGVWTALTLGVALAVGAALASDPPPTAREGRGEVPWGTARELATLAGELDAREATLTRREATLAEREADLAAVEAELTRRAAALEALREEIRALVDTADADAEARVTELVRRVEAMRDTQAAAVLAETEPELAVEVLRRMAPSKAGKALAKMNPAQAADLGERLARRVTLPEDL